MSAKDADEGCSFPFSSPHVPQRPSVRRVPRHVSLHPTVRRVQLARSLPVMSLRVCASGVCSSSRHRLRGSTGVPHTVEQGGSRCRPRASITTPPSGGRTVDSAAMSTADRPSATKAARSRASVAEPVIIEGPLSLSQEDGQLRLDVTESDTRTKLEDQFGRVAGLLARCHRDDTVDVVVNNVGGRTIAEVRIRSRARPSRPDRDLKALGRLVERVPQGADVFALEAPRDTPAPADVGLSVHLIFDAIVRAGMRAGHPITEKNAGDAAKLIAKLVMDEIRVSIVDDVAESVASRLATTRTTDQRPGLPPMVGAQDIVGSGLLKSLKRAGQWLRWAACAPAGRHGRLSCERERFLEWHGRYQAAGNRWSDGDDLRWRQHLGGAGESVAAVSPEMKKRGA